MTSTPDNPLRVGDVLYGYCGGAFGRDSYEDKRVEQVASDYVVARDLDSGAVNFYVGRPDDLTEYRTQRCGLCGGEHDDGECDGQW